MGCMGMTMDDVMRCTPSEFWSAYEAWHERNEDQEHAECERVRMMCLCTLQPHSQKKLSARDIMQFPWDKEAKKERKKKAHKLTSAEIAAQKAHYEAEKKARGII